MVIRIPIPNSSGRVDKAEYRPSGETLTDLRNRIQDAGIELYLTEVISHSCHNDDGGASQPMG